MLAGVLEFSAGEQAYTARAGDLVFLPRGVPHSFTNPGVGAAHALMLLTPGGFERFFHDIGLPAMPGQQAPRMGGDDLRHAAEAARQYGVRILSPEDAPRSADPQVSPAERLLHSDRLHGPGQDCRVPGGRRAAGIYQIVVDLAPVYAP